MENIDYSKLSTSREDIFLIAESNIPIKDYKKCVLVCEKSSGEVLELNAKPFKKGNSIRCFIDSKLIESETEPWKCYFKIVFLTGAILIGNRQTIDFSNLFNHK
jgi:hypothetical protein